MINQDKPDWFSGDWYEQGETVTALEGRHSGKKVQLTGPELSIYDFILGTKFILEMSSEIGNTPGSKENMTKALNWFIEANPIAYKILFDKN